MAETFKQSHQRLLMELATQGWALKANLKIPHATSPDGYTRFWFKPQAIWYTVGNQHDFAGARSLWVESRGLTVAKLISLAPKHE